jgi:hypothetical protein|tara:strand:- start:444 stop:950 length:507 start_codon:yes stop_codon:yes gene_type:complete
MADTLTDLFDANVQVKMSFTRTDTQEVGSVTNVKRGTTTYEIGDGSQSISAEFIYADTRTVSANSVDSLDLTNLTQSTLDVSVPFSFATIRLIRVVNNSTTSGDYLYLGADSSNPTQQFAIAVGAGGEVTMVNSLDTYGVNSSNGTFRIYNDASTSTEYEIYIIGSGS